jgi:hypothetical protein
MGLCKLGFAVLSACLVTGIASASSLSFQGAFTQDDQLQLFMFTAPSASFEVRTWSYAGGTAANGDTILPGGFDPVLSVFDANGGLVASSPLSGTNDNGLNICPAGSQFCVSTDLSTGNALDSLLQINSLNVGHTYVLVLSQADNLPNGNTFGAGFAEVGNPDFSTSFGCGGPDFCDGFGNQRNGNWDVDILNVGSASEVGAVGTPEPGSMFLLSAGFAGLALLRLRRKQV